MREESEAWCAARDAMVEIIKAWAAEGRTDCYGTLSSLLRESHFSVPPRGRLMSRLLKAACEVEADRRAPVMLTAIVVNKRTKQPSPQFEVLAKSEQFRRGDVQGWTWETERDAVFNHYRR
ncbi:hypothetical protein BGK67_33685 [Streptomyces subrutilus]|uniref:Uncharacterized protein n=1 Tax=Streptomyces subrutilus TaxID=36818 RepID=A0A1E5P0R0_9ACTN|nr:hypothetical protein BGK67_33685 [Streptomyces subrutilus]